MKLSIKQKLFLVIMLASSFVAISMYLFFRWSFEQDFLNYINQREEQHLIQFSHKLAEKYSETQSWDSIAVDHRAWMELLRKSAPKEFGPPPSKHRPRDGRRPDFASVHPPKPRRESKPHDRNFDGVNRRSRPPGKPRPGPERFGSRISLYDANKHLILGASDEPGKRGYLAIHYQEQIIGYLGVLPHREISETIEILFIEQQNKTFLVIALIALVFSLAFALISANHLVKPIRSLAQFTKALASGQFGIRSEIKTTDEVGDLARDFNFLAKTLQSNEKARQKWIADISHELRTPLSILRGEIEAIIDGVRKTDKQSLSSLHAEVLQLSRIVNDLYELSLSDLGALDYRKSNVDVTNAISTCIRKFSDAYQQKTIQITRSFDEESEILIYADGSRLNQLFTNLLKNTLRYTENNGTLDVQLDLLENEIEIHFLDSAPGVPESHMGRLFDPLFRLESSRNRSLGGAGLGLAICKNIVEAHDGEISAKNSPTGGLWITIRFNKV